MSTFGFYFDSNSCSGCKTCQIACKDKNDLAGGIRFRRVYEVSGAQWTKTDEGAWEHDIVAYNLSIACNHCEDPSCVKACPTEAMFIQPDGIIEIDPKKCIGCKYCEWACPYGAPQYNRQKGIMQKCNFCRDYILEGKMPVCVSACPMRALEFGPISQLIEKYGDNRSVYPLPDQALTKPSLFIKPHPGASRAHELGASIINREEVKNEQQ
ncbi:MAG: DMSO/selenate family reductase complex B subunit [Bacteroidales bacterium]|jgi:anaerobic dimethyl sulfoxide reductase subunit B (iron-sulfur subunit)